ncbi:hypothetical protein ABET41_13600 [Metabacillus fastidiosus]|uniref:Lipoprotein n=1 Tax=Metabacillus fastidiosus TaxID=1458 RepID=A0ABU6P286_9BACI|nr:hypothetical protein [Metabacillus fastidiosus]MED4403475.1 hypothetical protein [Metabacillus fastidiosus]MED4460829.1 hypothetical protein [Metabacillus fastidiosus]
MKKVSVLFLSIITVVILLTGCNLNDKDKSFDWNESIEKSKKIEVVLPGDSKAAVTIIDSEEIENFVESLKVNEWKLADKPLQAEEQAKYILYQADTVHLGESNKDNTELIEIAYIVTYKDIPYIDLRIKNVSLSFKVPDDVSSYLFNISK